MGTAVAELEARAVLPLSHDDPADADNMLLTGSEISRDDAVVLRAIKRWHKHADIAPDDFV